MVRERDLFGQWASRWRVIRTSNGFGSDKFTSQPVQPTGQLPAPRWADFFFNRLVLEFANGTTTTLNTLGTTDSGSIHPFQTTSGTFFLAPITGFTLPHNAHSVPTTFFV